MEKEIIEVNKKAQKEKSKTLFNITRLIALAQFKQLVIEVEEKTNIHNKRKTSNVRQ